MPSYIFEVGYMKVEKNITWEIWGPFFISRSSFGNVGIYSGMGNKVSDFNNVSMIHKSQRYLIISVNKRHTIYRYYEETLDGLHLVDEFDMEEIQKITMAEANNGWLIMLFLGNEEKILDIKYHNGKKIKNLYEKYYDYYDLLGYDSRDINLMKIFKGFGYTGIYIGECLYPYDGDDPRKVIDSKGEDFYVKCNNTQGIDEIEIPRRKTIMHVKEINGKMRILRKISNEDTFTQGCFMIEGTKIRDLISGRLFLDVEIFCMDEENKKTKIIEGIIKCGENRYRILLRGFSDII